MHETDSCSYSEMLISKYVFYFLINAEDFSQNTVKFGVLNEFSGCYSQKKVLEREQLLKTQDAIHLLKKMKKAIPFQIT